ncbi:hypothetical protein [Exiguobacterium mexicanum]
MTNEQMIEEILDKMNIINRGAIKAKNITVLTPRPSKRFMTM